jgi:hypothetical protein
VRAPVSSPCHVTITLYFLRVISADRPIEAMRAGLPALPTAFGQFTVRLVLIDQKVIHFDSRCGGNGACQIVPKTRPFPLGHFDYFRSRGSWRRRARRFTSAAAHLIF